MMTTLTSKIAGIQLWAYDAARRPDKSLSGGMPKFSGFTDLNTQYDTINPVTQKPTEFIDQAYNQFRYICDINHTANGNVIKTHGIKWTTGSNPDQQIKPVAGSSDARFTSVIFTDDDVYIEAPDDKPVLNNDKKVGFTTKTAGITIIDQTGIVDTLHGFSVIVFEVQKGYKIPVGNTVKINPTIQSVGGGYIAGAPETYHVSTEILPGIYEMTATSPDVPDWRKCDIDFATVQTEPTQPTIPVPQAKTIPIIQKLTHVTSNVTGSSIDRKLNAINLTADDGYAFKDGVEILFYSGGKVVTKYNVDGNNKGMITIPLNTTKENTITSDMDNIQLTAVATLSTLASGYEHNYLITETEMGALAKDRIWDFSSEIGAGYDIRPFIYNLIELPFKVDVPTTLTAISAGRVQSNVTSHETGSRFTELDLGTITVPSKYHNGYDYQSKSVKLYAPFVPPITINDENSIDKTIHISYKVDISSGDATINLDNQGVLFYTGAINLASQLPLMLKYQNEVVNHDTHFNDNGIRQPYIIVTRETPILNNDYYPTNERGLIKSYNGNVKVRLLNNMNIPNNELSELTSQLESGVKYVKSH